MVYNSWLKNIVKKKDLFTRARKIFNLNSPKSKCKKVINL